MALEISHLAVNYAGDSRAALTDLSLSAAANGMIAIVGASGVGKSTLLGSIAGIYLAGDSLLSTYTGQILLDGRRPDQIRGPRAVSWVPQHACLLDHLTVAENVLLPLRLAGLKPLVVEAAALLSRLGLHDRGESRPRELSGGMRAKVSLARAVISEPRYLFLDEPFVGMDLRSRWDVYSLLLRERSGAGMTTFITTHDIPEAMLLSSRVIVLRDTAFGTRATILENSPLFSERGSMQRDLAAARAASVAVEVEVFAGP